MSKTDFVLILLNSTLRNFYIRKMLKILHSYCTESQINSIVRFVVSVSSLTEKLAIFFRDVALGAPTVFAANQRFV